MSESMRTALTHLEMICQAAVGEYSPKVGELDKRRAALVAFIISGQCLASDSDRELAARVNEAVNSHFSTVNAEPAAPNADAA
jgi:hypothetical protein